MSPQVSHGTFVIDRVFHACPAHVFSAWASADAKAKWFNGPDGWELLERKLDFRPGGEERAIGRFPSGAVSKFHSRFYDIVPDTRIIYAYDMYVSDTKISVSLSTVDFRNENGGTRMIYTEQMAILDPQGSLASREEGTVWLFGNLEAALAAQTQK
ncbi:MAG: SRPBCC family protein [Parvularculaceae bacterium]